MRKENKRNNSSGLPQVFFLSSITICGNKRILSSSLIYFCQHSTQHEKNVPFTFRERIFFMDRFYADLSNSSIWILSAGYSHHKTNDDKRVFRDRKSFSFDHYSGQIKSRFDTYCSRNKCWKSETSSISLQKMKQRESFC